MSDTRQDHTSNRKAVLDQHGESETEAQAAERAAAVEVATDATLEGYADDIRSVSKRAGTALADGPLSLVASILVAQVLEERTLLQGWRWTEQDGKDEEKRRAARHLAQCRKTTRSVTSVAAVLIKAVKTGAEINLNSLPDEVKVVGTEALDEHLGGDEDSEDGDEE